MCWCNTDIYIVLSLGAGHEQYFSVQMQLEYMETGISEVSPDAAWWNLCSDTLLRDPAISRGGKEHSDRWADMWSNTHLCVCSAQRSAGNWIFSWGSCSQHRSQKRSSDLCATDIFSGSLSLYDLLLSVFSVLFSCLSLKGPDPVLLDQTREEDCSWPPWAFTPLDFFLIQLSSLCYREMSSHTEHFFTHLTSLCNNSAWPAKARNVHNE